MQPIVMSISIGSNKDCSEHWGKWGCNDELAQVEGNLPIDLDHLNTIIEVHLLETILNCE